MPNLPPETWSLEACQHAGALHAAHGWVRNLQGDYWNREQCEAYENAYAKESGDVVEEIVPSCLDDGTPTFCYARQASWPGPWVWPDQAELPNDPNLRTKRREAYRAGAYTKTTPDIYHKHWTEDAWCNWVDFHDKTLNGYMPHFVMPQDMSPTQPKEK